MVLQGGFLGRWDLRCQVPIHEIETLWLPFGILALRLQSARLLLLALCSMPVAILISFGFMHLGTDSAKAMKSYQREIQTRWTKNYLDTVFESLKFYIFLIFFDLRYFVSTQLPVILYALVMMLMLCTALSFDYSLFTMTRYGEERRKGSNLEDSIVSWENRVAEMGSPTCAPIFGTSFVHHFHFKTTFRNTFFSLRPRWSHKVVMWFWSLVWFLRSHMAPCFVSQARFFWKKIRWASWHDLTAWQVLLRAFVWPPAAWSCDSDCTWMAMSAMFVDVFQLSDAKVQKANLSITGRHVSMYQIIK